MTDISGKGRSEPRKPVGILDVAREAGVSAATVSRVLNGNPTVDPLIREQVQKTIDRLKYRPHYAARNLPRGHTGNIAIATLRGSRMIFSNPFFIKLFEGIGEVLDNSQFNLMFSTTQNQMKRLLSAQTVDGLILVSVREDDPFLADLEEEMDLPVVVAGAYYRQSSFTIYSLDNVRGTEMAVDYLVRLGHRRIGHLTGPVTSFKTHADREGFLKAVSHHGIGEVGSFTAEDFYEQSAYTSFLEYIRRGCPLPTAYVTASDNLAAGLLRAAREQAIKVPEDLSIIGSGDTSLATQLFPALTSLHGDVVGMGAEVTRALINMINKGRRIPNRIIYPLRLIERASSAPPKGDLFPVAAC